ncbi:hypothetical protein Trydic_g14265 [Trypoxylus dichotomus]
MRRIIRREEESIAESERPKSTAKRNDQYIQVILKSPPFNAISQENGNQRGGVGHQPAGCTVPDVNFESSPCHSIPDELDDDATETRDENRVHVSLIYGWTNSLRESRLAMEPRRDRPREGGPLTRDVVPNSLYQPITMLLRFRSSSIICATPMNTFLPSMRP